MKLLLDANLSWRLCAPLAERFGECVHVNSQKLTRPAKDSEIWRYAKGNGYVVVTQDADFLHLLETKGFPPKVILIKTGNLSRKQLERIFAQADSAITALDASNNTGLLEIQ